MAFTFPDHYPRLSQEDEEHWNYIKKIFDRVSIDFKVTQIPNMKLKNFEIINDRKSFRLLQTYNVQRDGNSFTLCLIEYSTIYKEAGSYGGRVKSRKHIYLFGCLNTTNDFGRAFLRPENFSDKIRELFSATELDLKGFDEFNRNYFLVTSDTNKFINAVNEQFINAITELKNVEMEFSGRKCLFRLEKAINLKETLDLCELGSRLSAAMKSDDSRSNLRA